MHFIWGILGFVIVSYLVGLIFFNEDDPQKRLKKGLITTTILSIIGIGILIYIFNQEKKGEDDQPIYRPRVNYCESLNGSKYGSGSLWYVRFFNQEGNIFEFTGEIEGVDANGKAKRDGNELLIISGNIKGKFTLISSCQSLTGSISYKSRTESFDYSRQ